MFKRVVMTILLLTSTVTANERHQMNFYNNISRAGYTPGLAYLYLYGENFGWELGGNYGLGSSTANVSYESFSANLLVTYRTKIDKKQTFMIKVGPSYREYTAIHNTLNSTITNTEISYYNYGFDYLYDLKSYGKIGFNYFADAFGIVYRIKF